MSESPSKNDNESAVNTKTPPRRRPTLARSRQFGSGRDEILSKRSLFSGEEGGSLHSVGSSSSRSLRALPPPSRRVSSGGEGVAARLRRQETSARERLAVMRRSVTENNNTKTLQEIGNGGQHEIAVMRLVNCGDDDEGDSPPNKEEEEKEEEENAAVPSFPFPRRLPPAPRVGAEKTDAPNPVIHARGGAFQPPKPAADGDLESQFYPPTGHSNNGDILQTTENLFPTEDLVEARLIDVEEEEDFYITEAAPIDPNDFAKELPSTRRKYQLLLRLFGICLLVSGVVIVALAVTGVFSPTDSTMIVPPTTMDSSNRFNFHSNETTTDLSDEITQILPAYTMEALENDDDDTAPQSRAYKWLLDDPSIYNYTDDRILQRFALTTIYYATMGDQWFLSNSWLDYASHECDWYSAAASDDPNNADVVEICNDLGEYQALVLVKNQLSGSIPPEVALLTSLKQVRLNNNILLSTLPTEMGLLAELEQLEVQSNFVEGSLPSEIGQLTNLRILWTAKNAMESTLPTSLGLLSELQSLSIGMNYFSGHIPSELGLLKQLQVCNMDLNFFWGSIPSELSHATRLNALKLSTNELSGSLPSELFTLSHLEFLDVASNFLSGQLPTNVGQMSKLRDFFVVYNFLTGPIPSSIGQLSQLEVLDLQYNDFTGTLPVEMGLMEDLERLYVRGNRNLHGTLPFELSALEHLTGISISETLLSGTVPLELCDTMDINMTCSDILCGCDCPCDD